MLRISKASQRDGFLMVFLMVFLWVFFLWVGDYLVGDLEEPPTMSVLEMVVLVFFTWALSEPKR